MRIRALGRADGLFHARFLGKMPKTQLQVIELQGVIFEKPRFLGKLPKNAPSDGRAPGRRFPKERPANSRFPTSGPIRLSPLCGPIPACRYTGEERS
jgi:hypothetical protein